MFDSLKKFFPNPPSFIIDEKPYPFSSTKNLVEGIVKTIDAVAIRNAQPIRGSIIYCDLAIVAEHSGVYVGNGQIVHLNGSGQIEKVNPSDFVARLEDKNPAFTIFCPTTITGTVIGSDEIANRALLALGKSREYNLLFDNCHRFSYYCLTGDSNFLDGSFSSLELALKQKYNFSHWRATDLGY